MSDEGSGRRRGGWPGPRKPNTNIRLPPDLTARLRSFAARTGQTVTAVIQAALGEYFDRHDTDQPEEGNR